MTIGPVVAAAHLAETGLPELSEMEFALAVASHAFSRWVVHCTAAAGEPGMSAMEVQVLHILYHRQRPKTIAQICMMLNVEDTHLVTYAYRKLRDRGLAQDERQGKEKALSVTPAGADLCDRYAKVRQRLLLDAVEQQGVAPADISKLAALLRALSGSYDQASRAAAIL